MSFLISFSVRLVENLLKIAFIKTISVATATVALHTPIMDT